MRWRLGSEKQELWQRNVPHMSSLVKKNRLRKWENGRTNTSDVRDLTRNHVWPKHSTKNPLTILIVWWTWVR